MISKTILHRFRASSTIISFLILSYALLAVADTPTRGYELSIYSSTPIIFWIAIVFGLVNGLFLITSDLYGKMGKMWMVGLFQIVFCNCLVISLYALRGYVCLRYDPMSSVGLAKDLYSYGFFGKNIYPISSILIATFSQFMGVPVLLISNYLSSVFFIIYIISIYCWSKSLISDRKFILCSLIASTPIFFAWFTTAIYPMLVSVLTIPFFFYCLQRNIDYRFRLFSIIWLIIYPLFHPITAIMIFLYLTTTFIYERIWSRLDEKGNQISTTLIIVSFVTVAGWFIWQYSLLSVFRIVFFQFLGILETRTTLSEARFYLFELGIMNALRSFLLMVADEIIYYFITLIAFFILLRDKRFKEKIIPTALCVVVGSFFILIVSIFARLHSFNRFINLNTNMVLTPTLIGYVLYKSLLNNEKIKTFLILGLIFISSFTAIFSLYPSPITILPNYQVTISDVSGMEWLINRKKLEVKTADLKSPVFIYSNLIYGLDFRLGRNDLRPALEIPYHFGFGKDNIFPIDEDRYLVIMEFDLEAYTKVWKDLDKFRKEDFIKVDYCTNVYKIYENGEFRSYFVHEDD